MAEDVEEAAEGGEPEKEEESIVGGCALGCVVVAAFVGLVVGTVYLTLWVIGLVS